MYWVYWRSKDDDLALKKYFYQREWSNLYLARFVYDALKFRSLRRYILILYTDNQSIIGIIALDKNHRLLVDSINTMDNVYSSIGSILLQWPKPYCLVGKKLDLLFLENFFVKSSNMNITIVDYWIMTISVEKMVHFSLLTPKEIEFRESSKQDFKELLILENGYQKEEVLADNYFNNVSGLTIAKYFKQRLQREKGFHLIYRNRILAKMSISVEGRTYDQVGGVYTIPQVRRKGLAKLLFWHLFQYYIRKGKSLTLFVKKSNISALCLYRRLGFVERQNFRISYL